MGGRRLASGRRLVRAAAFSSSLHSARIILQAKEHVSAFPEYGILHTGHVCLGMGFPSPAHVLENSDLPYPRATAHCPNQLVLVFWRSHGGPDLRFALIGPL